MTRGGSSGRAIVPRSASTDTGGRRRPRSHHATRDGAAGGRGSGRGGVPRDTCHPGRRAREPRLLSDVLGRARRVRGARGTRSRVEDPNVPCRLAVKEGAVKRSVLTVIDYSLPSHVRRLSVIDLVHGTVLARELVAHGRGSGKDVAQRLSNRRNRSSRASAPSSPRRRTRARTACRSRGPAFPLWRRPLHRIHTGHATTTLTLAAIEQRRTPPRRVWAARIQPAIRGRAG